VKRARLSITGSDPNVIMMGVDLRLDVRPTGAVWVVTDDDDGRELYTGDVDTDQVEAALRGIAARMGLDPQTLKVRP
jgi:hypothetical protein